MNMPLRYSLVLIVMLVLGGFVVSPLNAGKSKPWVGKTKAYIKLDCQGALAALFHGEGTIADFSNSPIGGTSRRGLGREMRSLDIPDGYDIRLCTEKNLAGDCVDLRDTGCTNVPTWIQGHVRSVRISRE